MEPVTVLSLFDGMSCGHIALERTGIPIKAYYASEIDKYAIQITQKNYPDTIQLGDITCWKEWNIPVPDLIIAGSPCQGFSNAGHGLNFEDPRSKLFFVFCDILAHFAGMNPNLKYLLENVKMKKVWQDIITDRMKVEPVLIDSALVSAQSRKRLYWANWTISQPEDKNLQWSDVQEWNAKNVFYYTEKSFAWINKDKKRREKFQVYNINTDTKMQMLEASHYKGYSNQRCFGIQDIDGVRYISPLECERLQTVDDNGTKYGLDFRFQQLYNAGNERNIPCQTSARYQNVINPSQTKKLNYAISTTIDSLGMELQKFLGNLSIRIKSVNGKGVNVQNKQLSVIVSSTIKDGKKKIIQIPRSVRFVISQLEMGHVECVLLTIQDGSEQELLKLTYHENMNLMETLTADTIRMKAVNFFTELLLNGRSEENLKVDKSFITLTLINLIIATSIFSCVKTTHITYLSIGSLNKLQGNLLEMGLLDLEMGNITEMSNTARYRCLGNGWTIDVLAHIFKALDF